MSKRTPATLLLQVRQMHEWIARRGFADARRAHAEAEALTRDATNRLHAMSLPRKCTSTEFLAGAASQRALATLVVAMQEHAAVTAVDEARARDGWFAADRDREAVDRLREQEKAEAREHQDHLERKEADDISIGRHAAQRAAKKGSDS
jgi:hypothetical protein